jgi:murein L,D-transpeptidase YcbB/YkuD
MWKSLFSGLILTLALVLPAAGAAPGPELLRRQVELLRDGVALTVADQPVVAGDLVAALYERRGFALAWTDPVNRHSLLQAIKASAADGLSPADYHAKALEDMATRFAAGSLHAEGRLAFDILLTDAYFTLLNHLDHGKLEPTKTVDNWHLKRAMWGRDVVELVDEALAEGDVATLVDLARHRHPFYWTLRTALRHYSYLGSTGGWPMVPDGATLKPGMRDERVVALRRRLAHGGDYDGLSEVEPMLYDDGLAQAVRRFQARHGLAVDGAVGKETLAALNVPVEARIDQIRLNMERARWVLGAFDGEFILVNIAGAYVHVIKDEKVLWESRVIVGKPYTETPVFRADLRYLVVNPTWNVTTTIARQELFPKIRKDPGYLEKNNLDLIDSNGQRVDPATIDFTGRLPFRIVQRAGDDNALGKVKFMFPNQYNVYLHDTPRRDLFSRSRRTFSHGCVRVQHPLELAELLLSREPNWDPAALRAQVESGRTRTIPLSKPLPVLILYWTVDPDIGGDIRFHADVYGRDAPLLRALDAPLRVQPRRSSLARD